MLNQMHPHCAHCLAKQGQAQPRGENCTEPPPVPAIPKLRLQPKVGLQQPLSGVISLTEMQLLMHRFCDSEPERCGAAGGKVEYCGSSPKIVGCPDQTHFNKNRNFVAILGNEGPTLDFIVVRFVPECFCDHILNGKKKVVAARC